MRDEQARMIKDIENVLNQGSHIVLEAPTGFGKTVTSLYAVINYALKNSKKILYLVRTNSQEQKVIEEAKKMGIIAVSMQGRAHMCPLIAENDEIKSGNAEELSLLCSKLKKEVNAGNRNACEYYANYLENGEKLRDYIMNVHTSEEIFKKGYEMDICPYEAVKDSMKNATLIAFPYIYFLAPFLRNSILDKMGVELKDIILIVDEAHNFPEFARELRSDELSEYSLDLVEKECLEYENKLILGKPCADIAEYIKEAIYRMGQFVEDEEGIIPHYAFEEAIGKIMGISINDISKLAMELLKLGMGIREEKMNRKKLPRSYIYHLGNFLLAWKDSYATEYIHIIKLNKNPKVEIFCLDPAEITEIIRNVHASIHMSGTLSLKNYRALINLPEEALLRRYSSPFPPENLKIMYVDDVTTKYEEIEENVEKIARYIEEITSIGRNTAVFFPSYSLLNKIMKISNINAMIEERGIKQVELQKRIDNFKDSGGVILSVFGGRISEGLDFPGKLLEIVVIVGIPYPKPTARLKMLTKYYDYKFGNGWEFAFKVPASIKMRQAIGRLIRSEKDRGVAIILDRRAIQFQDSIKAEKAKDITMEIKNFFEE